MKLTLLACAMLLSTNTLLAKEKNQQSFNIKDYNKVIADTLNNVDTSKQLIEVMTKLLIFSEDEKSKVLSFLRDQKVKINQRLPSVVAKNNELHFGKNITWIYEDGRGYRTKGGQFFKPQKNMAAADVFIMAFNAQNKKKSGRRHVYFIFS